MLPPIIGPMATPVSLATRHALQTTTTDRRQTTQCQRLNLTVGQKQYTGMSRSTCADKLSSHWQYIVSQKVIVCAASCYRFLRGTAS